jgi:hypothetical protein
LNVLALFLRVAGTPLGVDGAFFDDGPPFADGDSTP